MIFPWALGSRLFLFFLSSFFLLTPRHAVAEQEAFIRLAKDPSGKARALEVAVADYRLPSGQVVSLVGAVHVGDHTYYEQLNTLLRGYDQVLYELVGPKSVKPRPHVKRAGLLNALQEWFARIIGASLQLDSIDYSGANFVHADLSLEDLIEVGRKRGETVLQLLRKVLSDLLAAQTKLQELPFEPQNSLEAMLIYGDAKLRRLYLATALVYFAEQSGMPGLEALEPYILEARNEHALKVLHEVLKQHRRKRTFAIFYGAAHMPDIEHRLMSELKAKLVRTRWLEAWVL